RRHRRPRQRFGTFQVSPRICRAVRRRADGARPVGLFTIEGDRTWTSKLYRCGDVGVSTSRKSRFIRSWSSSSRLCRSTCQPEGQRVTRLRMHRARLPSELSQGGRGFNAESDETMPCVELPWTQQVDLRPFKES